MFSAGPFKGHRFINALFVVGPGAAFRGCLHACSSDSLFSPEGNNLASVMFPFKSPHPIHESTAYKNE